MASWRTLLEGDIHPLLRGQVNHALAAAGMKVRHRHGAIQVMRDSSLDAAWRLMEGLLDAHGQIVKHAGRDGGTAYLPYKPLERHVILAAMLQVVSTHGARVLRMPEASAPFLATLLHEAVWAQGLPNANHRASLLLIDRLVDLAGSSMDPDEKALSLAQDFVRDSKRLVPEKEFAPDAREAKAAHARLAIRYVEALLRLKKP